MTGKWDLVNSYEADLELIQVLTEALSTASEYCCEMPATVENKVRAALVDAALRLAQECAK